MLALGGAGLADLRAAQAATGTASSETSIILFWMWGGPSQLETYDPKPEAPFEYRGPFRAIRTQVPGMEFSEVFPLQARLARKVALVRSLHHEMSAHNDGSIEVLTGKTPSRPDPTSTATSEHPDFGMIASRLRGLHPEGVPRYVGIPRQPFMTRPTYLGLSNRGFDAGDPTPAAYLPPNLTAKPAAGDLALRRTLLEQFDDFRRRLDSARAMEGLDGFRAAAFRMLTSSAVAEAFDLKREHPRTRDRYGRHLWGQCCLLARRLCEAGTTVVTIDALAPTLSDRYFSWDDHINAETRWDLADAMRYRAPFMDQAISALIEDLFERGLDRRVLVVAMGEFGRTPKLVQSSGLIGRDHWPAAQSALVACGGIRGGTVVGATNARAEYPKDRPLSPRDLLATMYRHLGIDPRATFDDFLGRPTPILPDGSVLSELF